MRAERKPFEAHDSELEHGQVRLNITEQVFRGKTHPQGSLEIVSGGLFIPLGHRLLPLIVVQRSQFCGEGLSEMSQRSVCVAPMSDDVFCKSASVSSKKVGAHTLS